MIDAKQLKLLTSQLKVLYVEDDFDIQKSMSKFLNKFFSLVITASNGLEGLNSFEKNKFDIVITDLSMPKMNGLDMIAKIKEIDETQAILITTAHGESGHIMNAIKMHVDGYILKPFTGDSINFELFKISQRIKEFKENEAYKKNLQEMVHTQTKELQENYEKTLYSMVELIDKRDTYTAGHSKRVAQYSLLIAKEMGYTEDECTLLYQAGILHDIGKIETPDSILLNPKKLNDLEYTLIQEHVEVGYNLLKNIPMFESFADIIYSHHERYDGHGYPRGLKAEEINKLARIMIVADSFDAMTTSRIYKARKTVPIAIEELLSLSGKQFHPEVIKSAVGVLKDMKIDENINQLPHTKLEEEKFAYFYKDTLSQAYNESYLEVVLLRNLEENRLKHMIIFSIHHFSQYNKQYNWGKGNEVLKEFGDTLSIHLDKELVFRVFGDDFVLLCENKINIDGVVKVLDAIVLDSVLTYTIQHVDLNDVEIKSLNDIEVIQNKN